MDKKYNTYFWYLPTNILCYVNTSYCSETEVLEVLEVMFEGNSLLYRIVCLLFRST